MRLFDKEGARSFADAAFPNRGGLPDRPFRDALAYHRPRLLGLGPAGGDNCRALAGGRGGEVRSLCSCDGPGLSRAGGEERGLGEKGLRHGKRDSHGLRVRKLLDGHGLPLLTMPRTIP